MDLKENSNYLIIKKTGVESSSVFSMDNGTCKNSQISGGQSTSAEYPCRECDQYIGLKSSNRKTIVIQYLNEKSNGQILNNYNSGELYLGSLYFGLLLKELTNSTVYRRNFIRKWHKMLFVNIDSKFTCKEVSNSPNLNDGLGSSNTEIISVCKAGAECPSSSDCVPKLNMQTPVLTVFVVDSTSCFMDKRWCSMLRQSALELAELDSSMSWLSTLGGACSALGDHNLAWADRAAAISARQLVIANRLGDPAVVARCRLYAAIALIQKKDWKTAAAIIKREYQAVKKLPAEQQDGRLVKMCLGIWTKLSYERSMEKPT